MDREYISQLRVKDVLEWASEIPDKRFNELLEGIEEEDSYRKMTRKGRHELLGEVEEVYLLDEDGDWECPSCWGVNLGFKGNEIGDVVECDRVFGCGKQFTVVARKED